jgi:hypothetical protein
MAQPGPKEDTVVQPVRKKSARRATEPRTESGKAISRKNALKFGIFSRKLVISSDISSIPGVTKKSFRRLLQLYVHHYQPQGPTEMPQLEIAVGALWRYRRLLRAEGAGIERRMWEQNGIYERQTESETFLEIIDRCAFVPDSKTTEKLPKYEAHLLRVYYRALNELHCHIRTEDKLAAAEMDLSVPVSMACSSSSGRNSGEVI